MLAAIGYIKTLTPSVCAGDSGELTTAVYDMGACHPPGYPLYGIVGKLFTFIPVGDIAYRMNLFSGISAAGAVLFLFLICLKLLGFNRDTGKMSLQVHIPAIAATFMFAFSLTHWSQAVIGEVYALNVLLSAAVLYMMILWFEEIIYFRKEKDLHFAERTTILLAFVMGLSLTDHQLPMWYIAAWALAFAIPAILIIADEDRERFKSELISRLGPIVLFVLAIAIAFLLFIVYAYNKPLIMPGDLPPILIAIFIIPTYLTGYVIVVKLLKIRENWVDRFMRIFMVSFWVFLFAMTMYLYLLVRAQAIAPLPEPKPLSWGDTVSLDILFNHMLRKQYGRAGGNLRDMGAQMFSVVKFNVEQFGIVNALFAIVGIFLLFKRDKIVGFFSVVAVLLFAVMLVKFINFETDPRTLSFQEVFFIQEFLIIAIYIGFGYQFVLDVATEGIAYFKKKALPSGSEEER